MDPAVEQDAHEFGLHDKQGRWRLGLLVARNVEKGLGDRSLSRRDRDTKGKVSARGFARAAKTSPDRVLRYLEAWERAADEGVVPHAADLSPGKEVDLDVEMLPDWEHYYDGTANDHRGAYNRMTPREKERSDRQDATDPSLRALRGIQAVLEVKMGVNLCLQDATEELRSATSTGELTPELIQSIEEELEKFMVEFNFAKQLVGGEK
jgi:hypothetical protein